MHDNADAINNLKILEEKWGGFHIGNEEYEYLLMDIVLSRKIYKFSAKFSKFFIPKEFSKSGLRDTITLEDIDLIAENSELLDLIIEEYLKPKFPYPIDPTTTVLDELKFYNIKDGESIGEIGAGDGTFSIVLAVLNPSLSITINDLQQSYVEYIKSKIPKYESLLDTTRIKTIKGSRKETNFENGEMDKIIIRNAYHHFSRKKKMLKSIMASLKPEGRLYLYEPVIDYRKGDEKFPCRKVMSIDDMVISIEEKGFVLEKKQKLGCWELMEFKVDQRK